MDYPDYSFEPDSYYYDGGGSESGFGTFESSNSLKSHDEKRPAVGHGVPQRLDPDMSIEDLQVFLDQFYLIKTPEVRQFFQVVTQLILVVLGIFLSDYLIDRYQL